MAADLPHPPLLEDDPSEPGLTTRVEFVSSGATPSALVVCFFAEVIEQLAQRNDAAPVRRAHAARSTQCPL